MTPRSDRYQLGDIELNPQAVEDLALMVLQGDGYAVTKTDDGPCIVRDPAGDFVAVLHEGPEPRALTLADLVVFTQEVAGPE